MTSLWLIYKSYESCMYIYIWNYLSTCWFMLKDDDAKWCYGSLAFLACEYTYIIHLYVRIAYRFHRWPAVLPWLFHIVPQKAKRKVQVCESIHVNFRIVFMSMGPSRNGFVFFTKKCWSSFHGSMFGHASKTRMGICYHIHITWQWSSSLALSMIYIYMYIHSKRFNPARIFPPITSQTQIWKSNPARAGWTQPEKVLFVIGDLKSWKGTSELRIQIQSFR